MALFYNNDGTVSSIVINAIINGKVTSSAEVVPTIPTASNVGNINYSNFTYQQQRTLSNSTPTPSAFGAVDANTAFEAKYPKTTAANFAYNLRIPNGVVATSQFNSKFNFNNVTYLSSVTSNIWDTDNERGLVPGVPSTDEFPGGGSGTVSFDGIAQYFTALNSEVVGWLPGTGDFTIEWFMKKGVGGTSFPRVFSLGFNTTATIGVSIEGGTCYVWPYGGDLSGAMPAGYNNGTAWTHIAICRSGTTTKLFINGVLKATKTGDNRNINDSINPGFDLNVGVDDAESMSANWFSGKVTNFRWDNSAIYTSAFTVPTSPLSKTATTKLLMLGGGSTNPVYDAAKLNHLVNNGAQWDADTPFV